MKKHVNNEQGNSVWFDKSELDVNLKSNTNTESTSITSKQATDTCDFPLDDIALHKYINVTSHLPKEKNVPKIIDTTPKVLHGTIHNSDDLASPNSKVESPDMTPQIPEGKSGPIVIDSTPKFQTEQVHASNDFVNQNSKVYVSEDNKQTNLNLKQNSVANNSKTQNDLLDKITGIQNVGKDVYSINVSNSRFFVPNNYVFTKYENSMDDLSFKVDPEMTKTLRKSLEEKAKSLTDVRDKSKESSNNEKITTYNTKQYHNSDSFHTKTEPKISVQKVPEMNITDKELQDKEFYGVQLRRPVLKVTIAKDVSRNEVEENTYSTEVEFSKPIIEETNKEEITIDKIKRPLTENLQLSRSNFLRNSMHEMQHASLPFTRY